MRTVRRVRRAAVALFAALAVAGCSAGTTGPANTGNASGAASGEPRRGGDVTFVMGAEPRSLDPVALLNNWGFHAPVGNALYGTLISEVNPDDGSVTSGIAKSLTTSDKGLNWTLTLPDGLRFSDGTPFDAAAVALNWERHNDPKLASQSRAAAATIKSTRPKGQTLEFTLAQPMSQFAQVVMYSALNWIASPQALKGDAQAFNAKPVGAGPFVMREWARADKLVLVRNDKYYDSAKPHLDGVTFRFNTDESVRISTVQSGGADMTNLISPTNAALAQESGLVLSKGQLNGGNVLALNTRFAPFDDVRAREAVVKAIDPNAVNAAAFLGKAELPKTIFRENSPFYDPAIKVNPYDQKRAQALFDELAAAGKPVKFTITTFTGSETKKITEAIQAQLSRYAHVEVKLEPLDSAAAVAKIADNTFQAIPNSFSFADPEPLMYQTLHSASKDNHVGLSVPELDAALLKGRESADPAVRKQAYEVVAKQIADQYPFFFYSRAPSAVAAQPSVGGLRTYGLGSLVFDEVWLAK